MFAELSVKDKMSAGLKYARTQIKGMQKELGDLGATYAKFGSIAAAGLSIGGIGKAIKEASNMETLEASFKPLLKSADAAQKRMEELSKFAASTPFELPEIAKASMVLESLTRGALATGKGLTLVGDIAAATSRPFDEIAVSVGRLYDGLMSGRPVGEALSRLQELGAMSGEVRGQIEDLQKAGNKGMPVWDIAEKALMRFSGSMEVQSRTWSGKISTLTDNINLAFAAMGKPIMDTLKPELDKLNNYDFSTLGKNLGSNIAEAMRGLTDGITWKIWTLKGFAAIADLGSSIANVFESAINAGFDKITGKGSGSFMDDMIGYYDFLEKQGGTDFAKSLRKDAETLEKENARRFKNQRRDQILGGRLDGAAAADSVFGELFKELDKPKPTVPAIPVEIEKTAATEKAFDFQASKFELGQGPRAGLSLNADGGASTVKRGIDYLARIADILNTAKIQDKQLVWS